MYIKRQEREQVNVNALNYGLLPGALKQDCPPNLLNAAITKLNFVEIAHSGTSRLDEADPNFTYDIIAWSN